MAVEGAERLGGSLGCVAIPGGGLCHACRRRTADAAGVSEGLQHGGVWVVLQGQAHAFNYVEAGERQEFLKMHHPLTA